MNVYMFARINLFFCLLLFLASYVSWKIPVYLVNKQAFKLTCFFGGNSFYLVSHKPHKTETQCALVLRESHFGFP